MREPRVYWITGLSGAGKTTLANALVAQFRVKNIATALIDGDVMRELMGEVTAYDRQTRFELSKRYSAFCHYLVSQGINVVCSTISLFHETQTWNRQHIPGYCEIYLETSMEDLLKRDFKKIYDRAQKGELKNVVGIDIVAEYPMKPDFIFKSEAGLSVDACVNQILNQLTV
jgi:adenylylsulfate kinase